MTWLPYAHLRPRCVRFFRRGWNSDDIKKMRFSTWSNHQVDFSRITVRFELRMGWPGWTKIWVGNVCMMSSDAKYESSKQSKVYGNNFATESEVTFFWFLNLKKKWKETALIFPDTRFWDLWNTRFLFLCVPWNPWIWKPFPKVWNGTLMNTWKLYAHYLKMFLEISH